MSDISFKLMILAFNLIDFLHPYIDKRVQIVFQIISPSS